MTVVLEHAQGDVRRHARGLLLSAAATMLDVAAARLSLDHEPGGRPLLVGPEQPLHVSISHSGDLVAVALTPAGPVGVDVEAIRDLPALPLARRWFDAGEAEWVAGHPEHLRVRAFLWLWTHKEAIGKMRGTGLRDGGLRQPVPLPDAGAGELLRVVPADPTVAVAAPPAPPGYLLAVACPATAAGTRVRVGGADPRQD